MSWLEIASQIYVYEKLIGLGIFALLLILFIIVKLLDRCVECIHFSF